MAILAVMGTAARICCVQQGLPSLVTITLVFQMLECSGLEVTALDAVDFVAPADAAQIVHAVGDDKIVVHIAFALVVAVPH